MHAKVERADVETLDCRHVISMHLQNFRRKAIYAERCTEIRIPQESGMTDKILTAE